LRLASRETLYRFHIWRAGVLEIHYPVAARWGQPQTSSKIRVRIFVKPTKVVCYGKTLTLIFSFSLRLGSAAKLGGVSNGNA